MAETTDQTITFDIAKVDAAKRLVFGWASLSVNSEGEQVTDLQKDLIDPEELESAAYDFVLHSREAGEMHEGEADKGILIESFMVDSGKLEKMGLVGYATPQVGWWLGFKVSEDTFKKVQDGKLRMFSIQGSAQRVPIEEAA
ncbi:MAG: XkdF-like putative serine protease domain-containing protein [Methylococcaceae bacterium]|nr:XkdF-like putative serine protease domain-containing protein [Methylococcaceae bacterium]